MAFSDFEGSSEPTGEAIASAEGTGIEKADDLFDFDELVKNAEATSAYLDKELDRATGWSGDSAGGAAPVEPAPRAPSRAFEPHVAGAQPPGTAAVHTAADAAKRRWRLRPATLGPLTLSRVFTVALVLIAGVNVFLFAVSLKSLETLQAAVVRLGERSPGAAATLAATLDEHAQTSSGPRSEHLGPVVRPEGYAALESSLRDMDLGDYRGARRRLYSVLAVIDRLDESVRTDLEPQARFYIAESYRREADALGAGL